MLDKVGLFTIIAEYAGGTYVRQFDAFNVEDALNQWVESGIEVVPGLKDLRTEQLKLAVVDELPPTEVGDCNGVWCIAPLVEDQMLLVHLIQTTIATQEAAD